jgi:molybdate-binding protein/DNA-binding XRE family transcriptional regulator
VRTLRQRLGIQQQDLATQIGVSRQTLSSIEAGETVPSTVIALNLARVLNCRVEDLFTLGEGAHNLEAVFVADPGLPTKESGKMRVALGQVGDRWWARPLDGDPAVALGTPADGLASAPKGKDHTVRVHPLRDLDGLRRNVLVAGCDPALGLLDRHLEERFRGPRLHWIERASRPSLEELALGRVHMAGLHLDDANGNNGNASAVRSRFADRPMMLVTLAAWELGLACRSADARHLRSVADLARKGTRVIVREAGAGAQELLESSLQRQGLSMKALTVAGVVRGHGGAAQMIATGAGDAGITTRAAARPYGLAFVPLAEARFDLVFGADAAADARVQAVLDCMASARFRKDLGAFTGYLTSKTGNTVQGATA